MTVAPAAEFIVHIAALGQRAWFRRDGATLLRAADNRDLTPEHSSYMAGYNPRCGYCWLGGPHTEAFHNLPANQ
jgi:hypothetical protein